MGSLIPMFLARRKQSSDRLFPLASEVRELSKSQRGITSGLVNEREIIRVVKADLSLAGQIGNVCKARLRMFLKFIHILTAPDPPLNSKYLSPHHRPCLFFPSTSDSKIRVTSLGLLPL